MSLLGEFLAIVEDWRSVFPQRRTWQRGVRQALGSLVCLSRRCPGGNPRSGQCSLSMDQPVCCARQSGWL